MFTRSNAIVRLGALAAGVASLTAYSPHSLAQDTANESVEEIVVTGTRIRNADPVGSNVIAIDSEAVSASGAVTTDRVIREVPQIYDLGVSENSRAQAGGNGNIVYGNTANLRGLGPYATLIIVDGKRVVNNSRSVDPSIIPTLGVERVEILADGSSAIYGSDAIAGVVNIIPRRSLDGFDVLGRYGISDDGDFDEYQIGAAFGKVWDGGQFMIAYEHVLRSNLNGLDRDFFTNDQTSSGGNDYRVTACSPGTISAGGVTYAIPAGGVAVGNEASLVPGTANRCDSQIGMDLFPEQEYDSVNSTFTFDFTDRLSFVGSGFFSERKFTRNQASASANLTVPNTNAFYVTPPGFAGTSYTVQYNFIDDLATDVQEGHAQSWQISPGLRFAITDDWSIEGYISYGENDDNYETDGGLNNGALAAALASGDPATAFDPYGLHRTNDAVLAGLTDQIFFAPTLNDYMGYEISANGPLFELPGGTVMVAFGAERQELTTDLGLARGAPTTPMVFRTFERNVNSYYTEFLIPIFGDNNAVSGAQRLELTAAVRYDDYDDVGSTSNPKFGVSWAPAEMISFRATYGTSFRAPLISQIYGNSNALFGQNYQDPAGGPPILGFAYSGPNTELGPEEATTWTVGTDWDVTDNFRVSLTYFDIEYESQVETYLADLGILGREDQFAGTGIILRDAAAGARVTELTNQGIPLARGSFPGGDPANVTLYVDGRNNNLGRSVTNGIDFALTYTLETSGYGSYLFDWNGMYLNDYQVSITPTGTLNDRLNEIFEPLKFKSRASVTWLMGDWRTQLKVSHVNGYDNVLVTPTQSVSSYTPVDLSVAWNIGGDSDGNGFFNDGFIVGLEVRNALDDDPPYVNLAPGGNGSGGYDATTTNPVGRMYSVQLRKSW
jgi:iron complex outermembrane receptor protein